MKLYEYEESGNSYKVRLLLSFLRLTYEPIIVDLLEDEQHQTAFLAVNPRGEVPVLDDQGFMIRDSMAILVYLATRYGGGRWIRTEPRSLAEIMEWLAFAASWIQYGVFTARALVSFGIPANGLPADFPASLEEAKIRGHKSLEILNRHLARNEWLACGEPTIADIANFPYVALAPMGDISLSGYPAVEQWIGRFKNLPGFISVAGLDDPDYRKPR